MVSPKGRERWLAEWNERRRLCCPVPKLAHLILVNAGYVTQGPRDTQS